MRQLPKANRRRIRCALLAGLLAVPLLGTVPRCASAAPAVPVAAQTADARQLLRLMLRAEGTLAFAGEQTTTLVRGGKTVTTRQRVLRDGARGLRVEYLAPPRFAGEQIVDNGHLYRHYVPTANTLEIGPSRLPRLRGRVPQVMERVRRGALSVETVGTETVAGHLCTIVQVKTVGGAPAPWRRFWIDPATGAQLRIEQYDRDGKRVSVSSFTSIAYNPGLSAQSFHAPQTPRDVRVLASDPAPPLATVAQAQAAAGFAVLEPAALPPGYRFQSASVADYRGRTLVTLRYVNGLSVLSLFETPAPRAKASAPGATHPRRTVAQTFQAGLRVILVGSLAPDEMERVLGSLH